MDGLDGVDRPQTPAEATERVVNGHGVGSGGADAQDSDGVREEGGDELSATEQTGDSPPAGAAGGDGETAPRDPLSLLESIQSEEPARPLSPGEEAFTHHELLDFYRRTLDELVASDPLLSDLDLPGLMTSAEVRSLTALEHGTAMGIIVNRGNRLTRVIVERTATVHDLKRALRSAVTLELERQCRRVAISWRHIWRTNWLCYRGRHLMEDSAKLADLGMVNNSEVGFVKRIRAKRGQREKKAGQLQQPQGREEAS